MATKNVFVKASVLPNVVGRVDYISNPKRQEHLFAFYQTPASPETFWKDLSEVSSERANYHKGARVIEAREHILQLPNDLLNGNHAELARKLAESFKAAHGVECAVGIHLNKDKTNYHAHVIIPERRLLEDQKVSIAGRNTYFDANGIRSTKGKCVSADGSLLPGCTLVRKGEAFPVKKFSGKDNHFASREFLLGEKHRYAKMFSELSADRWIVYDHKRNPHMRLMNLKRGEPDGLRAWKERENERIRIYNAAIDKMLGSGEMTVEQALQVKKQLYAERSAERQARADRKAEWIAWYAGAADRRAAWSQRRRNEWTQIRYRDSGGRRSIFELVAILGLTVAGVDVFKNDVAELGDNMIVRPPRQGVNIEKSRRLQYRVDQIYRAAGRKPPSEILAEQKVARLANGGTMQQNQRLEDLMRGAATQKEKTPGKSQEQERSGVDPPKL